MELFFEQLAASSLAEWVGMVTGILGVWLSVRQSVLAWPCFIACYACYIYISYQFGLPALLGMNIVFVGLSLYGWSRWTQPAAGATSLRVTRASPMHWPWVIVFLTLGTLLCGWLLDRYEGANLPYADAFAACCGLTAQWMLGRKHIETWAFWILSDLVYLGLFAAGGAWPSVVLFGTFLVLALTGWYQWRQSLENDSDGQAPGTVEADYTGG